jgi:hypothetical protein
MLLFYHLCKEMFLQCCGIVGKLLFSYTYKLRIEGVYSRLYSKCVYDVSELLKGCEKSAALSIMCSGEKCKYRMGRL